MALEQPIRVRATAPGLYSIDGLHKYREAGEEFEIANEKAFSKKWMEKLKPSKPEKPSDEK